MKRFFIATLMGLMSLSQVAWSQDAAPAGSPTPKPAATPAVTTAKDCSAQDSRAVQLPAVSKDDENTDVYFTLVPKGPAETRWDLNSDQVSSGDKYLYCVQIKVKTDKTVTPFDCKGSITKGSKVIRSDRATACELASALLKNEFPNLKSEFKKWIDEAVAKSEEMEKAEAERLAKEKKDRENCTIEDAKEKILCLADKAEAGKAGFSGKLDQALMEMAKDKNLEEIKELLGEFSGNPRVAKPLAQIAVVIADKEMSQSFYDRMAPQMIQRLRVMGQSNPNQQAWIAQETQALIRNQAMLEDRNLNTQINEIAALAGLDRDALGIDTAPHLQAITNGLTHSLSQKRLGSYQSMVLAAGLGTGRGGLLELPGLENAEKDYKYDSPLLRQLLERRLQFGFRGDDRFMDDMLSFNQPYTNGLLRDFSQFQFEDARGTLGMKPTTIGDIHSDGRIPSGRGGRGGTSRLNMGARTGLSSGMPVLGSPGI